MINRRTEETASLYVLDLLTGEERASFESEMRDSAELQRLVRELSAGLHEPIKQATGPVRDDLLEGILARTMPRGAAAGGNGVISARLPWAAIWAVAALILLGMNLILLFLLKEQTAIGADGMLATGPDATLAPGGEIDEPDPDPGKIILEAKIARLEEALAVTDAAASGYREALQRLEGENREFREYNAEWQHEYARLAARILPFFEPNDGLGRFTVIEMVDNEAFLNDLPRRGFADLAGRYLSGEGNIAGIGSQDFVGPVVEGAGVASATRDPSQGGFNPISRGAAVPVAEGAGAGEPIPAPAAPTTDPASAQATGFTVWRDDEQKGFLDLYNLPQLADGQEAHLWVRASDLDPYLPVGIIPQLENGTGSLFYSVDEPNFTPTEILITAEDAGAPGPEPGDSVILRGP